MILKVNNINLEENERIDTLSGNQIIVQPQKGQRYTTDDLLLAWFAIKTIKEEKLNPKKFIDFCSGLGTVPMILLYNFENLFGKGFDIDQNKTKMAKKSLKKNQLDHRFKIITQDINEIESEEEFDFCSCTPPYFDETEGLVPKNKQQASSRFELNGSIDTFIKKAYQTTNKTGWLFIVYPTKNKERILKAINSSDFYLKEELTVITRETKKSLMTFYALRKQKCNTKKTNLILRKKDGTLTKEYLQIRTEIGFSNKNQK